MAQDFLQRKDVPAGHHEMCGECVTQNVGKLPARKHNGGFIHHWQELEVAIRKELEAVQGNDFLIQLFADRNTAVLFAFGPDKRDSVLCDLGAGKVHRFAPARSGTQADFNDQSE